MTLWMLDHFAEMQRNGGESRPATRVDRLREDGWEGCDPRLEVHPEICECQGLGLVPPDWMVEAAARAIFGVERPEWRNGRELPPEHRHANQYWRCKSKARAALVEAARAVKEKE